MAGAWLVSMGRSKAGDTTKICIGRISRQPIKATPSTILILILIIMILRFISQPIDHLELAVHGLWFYRKRLRSQALREHTTAIDAQFSCFKGCPGLVTQGFRGNFYPWIGVVL